MLGDPESHQSDVSRYNWSISEIQISQTPRRGAGPKVREKKRGVPPFEREQVA